MLLGFKTELKLNKSQRVLLAKQAGTARHAWNWGLGLTQQILDNNKSNPEHQIKFPSAIDLHKWLVALVKPENPWYYEVSKAAPQYALRQLREAWDRCFKKVSGVPRFKKKGRKDSFTLDGAIKVEQFQVKSPVIGWLKTYERLPQGINPKSITISRHAQGWFIWNTKLICMAASWCLWIDSIPAVKLAPTVVPSSNLCRYLNGYSGVINVSLSVTEI